MAQFNVLIIDDNHIDRYIIKEYLEMAKDDYIIHEVMDGEEGMDFLEKSETAPDIILVDINMPRIGGFEFLEYYTKQYSDQKSMIFMLSSSDMDYEIEQAKSFKAVKDFLVKPFNMDNIAKIYQYIA